MSLVLPRMHKLLHKILVALSNAHIREWVLQTSIDSPSDTWLTFLWGSFIMERKLFDWCGGWLTFWFVTIWEVGVSLNGSIKRLPKSLSSTLKPFPFWVVFPKSDKVLLLLATTKSLAFLISSVSGNATEKMFTSVLQSYPMGEFQKPCFFAGGGMLFFGSNFLIRGKSMWDNSPQVAVGVDNFTFDESFSATAVA